MIDADLPPSARVSFSGSVRFPIEPGRSFPRVVRFALSSRIDRSAVGREKNRGEERGRESAKLTTVFSATDSSVQGSRLFQRDCSVLLLRSAHAPPIGARTHTRARAYNTYVTHTRARVYTTQDTTRDERRDASCALTLAVDERRPRWIKKERVGEGK